MAFACTTQAHKLIYLQAYIASFGGSTPEAARARQQAARKR